MDATDTKILLSQCAEALSESSGLIVCVDASGRLEISSGSGVVHFVPLVRSNIDKLEALGQVKASLAAMKAGVGVLITSYLTQNLADKCRELELPFVDRAGNAFLFHKGLRLLIVGRKATQHRVMGSGGSSASLKVQFALLTHPSLIEKPLREIASASGISLSSVHHGINDLVERGLVSPENSRSPRAIIHVRKIFEEWATNYPMALKPKLRMLRFHCPNAEWWKNADTKNALWSGEVAASQMTSYNQPATQVLYVPEVSFDSVVKDMAMLNRWQAAPNGEITIIQAFQTFAVDARWPSCVPAPLVYADLVASLESRNLETAKVLLDEVIENGLAAYS